MRIGGITDDSRHDCSTLSGSFLIEVVPQLVGDGLELHIDFAGEDIYSA